MTVLRDAEGRLVNVDRIREQFVLVEPRIGGEWRSATTIVMFEGEQQVIRWDTRADAEHFLALLAGEDDGHPSMFTPQLVPSEAATAIQMRDFQASGGVL